MPGFFVLISIISLVPEIDMKTTEVSGMSATTGDMLKSETSNDRYLVVAHWSHQLGLVKINEYSGSAEVIEGKTKVTIIYRDKIPLFLKQK